MPYSTKVAGASAPVVNLRWVEGQEVQEADVKPGESGVVTFYGTAYADLPCGLPQEVNVNLFSSTDQGWHATVTPATILLQTGTKEEPFSVTVAVTPETSHNISGTLTVGGKAMVYPGSLFYSVQSIEGTIGIKQYHKFTLTCIKPTQTLEKGEKINYKLKIKNFGNSIDKFQLNITNKNELKEGGLKIQIQDLLKLNSKGTQTINLTIKTKEFMESGESEFNLFVECSLEEKNESYSRTEAITLTLFVKDKWYLYPVSISFLIIYLIILTTILLKPRKIKK